MYLKKTVIRKVDKLLVEMYLDFVKQVEEAMWVEKPKAKKIFKEVFRKACQAKTKF
jgi:hypothetical protein